MSTVGSLAQSLLVRNNISSIQDQLNTLQQQVSSGLKTDNYGGLGAQATLDINLRNQVDRLNTYNTDITSLQTRTGIVDQTLNAVHDSTLNMRSVVIQNLNNASGNNTIIQAAQQAIADITNKLQANVDGRYLFAGTKIDQPPMVADSTILPQIQALIVNPSSPPGAPGVLQQTPTPANIPAAIQAAVSGFFATSTNYYAGGSAYPGSHIDDGVTVNTSITGNDPAVTQLLTGLYTIASLPQPVPDPATPPSLGQSDFNTTVQNASNMISSALSGLETLIAQNGTSQKLLDTTQQNHAATLTLVKGQVDDIENVDMAEASTRVTQLQTQLQASYELTALLKDLSLTNFLK
jgi:flagellin-like hook-associated protein FlgL